MGKPLFSQNQLAIQTFGGEKVCRDKKNSSTCENPFATGQWGPDESWVTVKISRLLFFTIFAAVFLKNFVV